jgi:predicted nuclease of predicted toxin-antitoxin system
LKLGNCTTAQIETLLVANVSQIEAFVTAGTSRILVLL